MKKIPVQGAPDENLHPFHKECEACGLQEGTVRSNPEVNCINGLKHRFYHHYWCDDCEGKFAGYEAKCPECNGTNVGIDEPIIRIPKTKKIE